MDTIFLSNLSIQSIVSANRIYTQKNGSAIKRNRPYWGLAIKLSGETKYTCNGIDTLSTPCNVTLLPKGASYFWKSSGGECLLIDFDADCVAEELTSFYLKDNSKAIDLFNKIQTLLILKPNYYKMKATQLLYKLLLLLFESENKKYIPSKKVEKIAPAVEYIVQHYDDSEITGEFLSTLANISYTYFRKIFTQVYGCPPMEYLTLLRMKKAAEMLKTDYASIEAVSISVGYNSIYHFSKMFKKHFGVSPSKFISLR